MKRIFAVVAMLALIASPGFAQTKTAALNAPTPQASTSQGFSGESDAVAVDYAGSWSAGTLVTESYDFMDFGTAKTNHVYIVGSELIAPTPGFNIYAGGVRFEPNLSKLFAKTNVQPGSFSAFFSAAAGTAVPATGNSHIAFLLGGGVKYQITPSLTWQTLQASWMRTGAQSGAYLSSGLSFVFGKPR